MSSWQIKWNAAELLDAEEVRPANERDFKHFLASYMNVLQCSTCTYTTFEAENAGRPTYYENG